MNRLQIVNGEICYLSEDNDQTYGMWCPVSYDTNHNLKNGTYFYLEDEFNEIQHVKAKIEKYDEAIGWLQSVYAILMMGQGQSKHPLNRFTKGIGEFLMKGDL